MAETPQTPQQPTHTGGILPGMAAIAMFLLFVSMFTAFQVMRAHMESQAAKYSILAVCTMVAIGVFGLIRMRRWGWALVCGGCILGSMANLFAFSGTHVGGYLVQGLFSLVFFLYLVRTEVRERLR